MGVKKTILIFLFFFCAFSAHPQSNAIDSLEKVLQTQKDDTNKVNTLNALSEEFRNEKNDYEQALQYAGHALSLADNINYKKGKGNSVLQIGQIHYRQKTYADAYKEFNTALNFYQEIGDKKDISKVYSIIGSSYLFKGSFNDALTNYFNALKFFKDAGDKKEIANFYQKIGVTYSNMGLYGDALSNAYDALKIYEEIRDEYQISQSLHRVGLLYELQGNDSEALINYKSSLKLCLELDDKPGVAHSLVSIGSIYNDLGNNDEAVKEESAALKIAKNLGKSSETLIAYCYQKIGEALEKSGDKSNKESDKTTATKKYNDAFDNFLSSLKIWEDIGSNTAIADLNTKVGLIQIKLKNFSAAKSCFQRSLQLLATISMKDALRDSYRGLAILDSIDGNYKHAYNHYKLYVLYRDSLLNDEVTKKSQQAKMQYESDKKEAIAKALQNKKDAEAKHIRNLQYFAIAALAVLAVVILLIAFIQWRNNNHKKKANILLQQQKEKVESTLTELKSTQSQLIQSEKMASLGELTAGIAHEIQNPLNFVNNFSEVNKELIQELKNEILSDNKQEAISIANDIDNNEKKINYHGKRADAIVKGMLQHSRSSTGIKEPTDINALADEYLRLAYHGLRAKDQSFNVTLQTDYDETIGKINITPQDIGRVLLNLYTNAFYAVTEKIKQHVENYEPTVSVSTKKLADKIEIRVRDNGNGIPQKVVDKIFQPFFTTKPTGQGTGLGLSLSYDIITKTHLGIIKAETKEGEFAEFVILLPA
jgi:two-component system NtrC family sensor kinase